MKKIINGKMYNTETAQEIYTWKNGLGWSDFRCIEETLYRKKTGEFFIYGVGGAMTRWAESCADNSRTGGEGILPVTESQAKGFLERYDAIDEYIALFGEPEE